jgi:serine/threonine-protein kinase
MPLTIGTQLGSHEITALLGKGGMGEVYRARDLKLKREVAIKVLPEEFSRDADRVNRFQREAEVLASLNHPNIAAIHDLAEVNGSRYLVLELVEGETLADRIAHGPIPVGEALNIGKQITEALEAAHERGIIHRDLKPANVKITPDGKVKVLDFGLARALETGPNSNFSNSPTLSLAATQAGIILGTAAYMSPEQAKGKTADRRADIWAFGVVLYEMLTGRTMFSGETASETMAHVMLKDPDWDALPEDTPSRLRDLLRRCLLKDPRKRMRDIGEVCVAIEDIIATPEPRAETTTVPGDSRPGRRLPTWTVAALGLLLGASVVLSMWQPWRTVAPGNPVRLSAELGVDASLASNILSNSALALSPDGSILAFVAEKNGTTQIYIRRLAQLQASALAGTSNARSPFFNTEGTWLAFFADGKLKKISVTGGAAITLADAVNGQGGSWGDDDNIVFTPNAGQSLLRVPSAGGKVEPVTMLAPGEASHRWPQVLPGSKAVLYMSNVVVGSYEDANLVVQSLPSGTPKVLMRGGYHPRYVPSGHLVYIHEGTLFAVPFDLSRLEVTGQSVPVVEGVSAQPGRAAAQFAVSRTGALAYLTGLSVGNDSPVVWLSHDGKTAPLRAMPSNWADPRFSPDGRKLALDILGAIGANGPVTSLWVYDWTRDTPTRLTFDGIARTPVWTPNGNRIVFAASIPGKAVLNLYWQRSDGTGEVQRLTDGSNTVIPSSFHPSGKYLAFSETTNNFGDLMILPLEGDENSGWKPGKPFAFLNKPANERKPMFSPDGRWIAYTSDENGRGDDVFVRPFPMGDRKWQISPNGGGDPVWSRTRNELLYRGPDRHIMVVPYTVEGDSFKADKPRIWSEQVIWARAYQSSYDLHPDGQRLAVALPLAQAEEKLDKMTFIFNFSDELRRIAPATKK